MSISVGDYWTPGGVRLEGTGVHPDQILLPTPEALRKGEDPVLSQVLRELGLDVSPLEAALLKRQGDRLSDGQETLRAGSKGRKWR